MKHSRFGPSKRNKSLKRSTPFGKFIHEVLVLLEENLVYKGLYNMVLVILVNVLLAYIKKENVKGELLEKGVTMIFGFDLCPRTIMWLLKSQIIYTFTIFIESFTQKTKRKTSTCAKSL